MAEVLLLVPRNRIRRALKYAAMSADVLAEILAEANDSAPAKAERRSNTKTRVEPGPPARSP